MLDAQSLKKALRAARSPEQRAKVFIMGRRDQGTLRPPPGERTSWNRMCTRLEAAGFRVVALGNERYRIEEA